MKRIWWALALAGCGPASGGEGATTQALAPASELRVAVGGRRLPLTGRLI